VNCRIPVNTLVKPMPAGFTTLVPVIDAVER
jgi:hypothetical protein